MTATSAIMARPMAANPQAAAVTDRYREQALALRRLALAAGQSAYELALIPRPGDGLGDLDARWARFTRAATAAAAGHQRAHVRLAADYHRAYMAAALPKPPAPPPLDPEQYAGVMDDGRPLAQGLAGGLVAVRLALLRAEPPDRALLAGWNQSGRLIGHQVLQAGRSALRDVMAADTAVTGWERVVGDTACGACLALADGVYPDGDLPDVHDNCSCTAEPVAGDGPPGDPRPTGEELFDRLDDREQAARFAGRGGEAKAALVRARPDGTRPVPFRDLAQRHPQAVRAPVVTERPLIDLKPDAPRRSWDGAKFAGERDRPKAIDVAPERTPAGDYVFYHGTSKEGAARIIKEGRLRPDDFNNVGLATTPGAAQSYAAIKGGEVLRVTVPRATLARHELGREIGGSGRNQFLLKPVKVAGKLESQTPWEGIPVTAAAPAAERAAASAAVAPLTTPPAGPAPAPVTAATFERHFDAFLKSSPQADYLTPYTRPELERMTTYLANGGRTGGAIKVADDGVREAVSLFNNGGPRGAGLAMLDHLAASGATRLDCTGDGLRAIYETRGWRVTKTIPWDDQYAPAGWDYAARGRPNIYVMERKPA